MPAWLILGLSALFDGGLLFRMLVLGAVPDREALSDTSVFISAQLAICLLVPVMMAFLVRAGPRRMA